MSLTFSELHRIPEPERTAEHWQLKAGISYALARVYLEWGKPYLHLAAYCQTAAAEQAAQARKMMGLA